MMQTMIGEGAQPRQIRTPQRLTLTPRPPLLINSVRGPLTQFKARKRTKAIESDSDVGTKSGRDDEHSDFDSDESSASNYGHQGHRGKPHKLRRDKRRGSADLDSDSEEDDPRHHQKSSRRNTSTKSGARSKLHKSGTTGTRKGESSHGEEEATRTTETEMSCGWVMLPLAELTREQERGKHLRYQLQGGTPFARASINKDEVMTRRYGWRALLKAMKVGGQSKSSEIEIKVLPISSLSAEKQEDVQRLPRNIVVSYPFIPLIRYYREYASDVFANHTDRAKGTAGFGCVGAFSEPVLALFPRIVCDSALMLALKGLWDQQRKKHGPGMPGKLKAFEACVLRVWPAMTNMGVHPDKMRSESLEKSEERAQLIKKVVSGTDSFRSDTPTHSEHKRHKEFGAAMQLCIAFTTREVAFDVQ
jgi:hypothetical protein